MERGGVLSLSINTAEGGLCSRNVYHGMTLQARLDYSTWRIESAGNRASKRAQARSRYVESLDSRVSLTR